ncbi:MAG: DUF4124 domain-containing protein [Gammaproteobacteria bacterium]|nr:DUF4124 domain-containing protein [Gammaproteobacteria bacterium]
MVKAGMACVVLALMAGSAQAAVYKYTDEHGRVHYSDKPPHDEAKPMTLLKSQPAADAADLAERRERAGRLSQALEEEAEEAAVERKARESKAQDLNRRCQWARDQLDQMRGASGVYELDEKGQRRYYDAAQRARGEAELSATIARNCR